MIEVKCDHCGFVEKEPIESVNIYHVWKDNEVTLGKTIVSNRHQLCKECYKKWCEIMDAYDNEKERIIKEHQKKEIKFHNEFCNFT